MSDPESLYQEAQEYKHEQRMADKNHVFPCEQCNKMTHESELESVNNEEICKECRGKLSECCGADVGAVLRDFLGTPIPKGKFYPSKNTEGSVGWCYKCGNKQIYSTKTGWQNNE